MSDTENNYLDDGSEQVEVRRQKLAKLREGGLRAYPNDFKPTHTVSAIVADFAAAEDERLIGLAGPRIPPRWRWPGR